MTGREHRPIRAIDRPSRLAAALTALLVAAMSSCASEQPTTIVAPDVLASGHHFTETAQFGSGRATAATSSDGHDLLVATTTGVVGWSPTTEAVDLETEANLPLADVMVSSTGDSAVLITTSGSGELWAIDDHPQLLANLDDVRSVDFQDDGSTLLVATSTGLSRHQTSDGSVTASTELPADSIAKVIAWNTDSASAFVVAEDATTTTTWSWDAEGDLAQLAVDDASTIERAAFDAPRNRVVLGTTSEEGRFDGRLRTWDLAAGSEGWALDVGTDLSAPTWAVGTDGSVLLTDGLDVQLIGEGGTTVTPWTLDGTESVASVIAFDQSPGYAIVRSNGSVTLVDADGQRAGELPTSGSTLLSIDEFAGTPGLVTVDYHGLIRTWASDASLSSENLDHVAGTVNEVTVSPDGDLVGFATAAGNAGVVDIGDVTSGGPPAPLPNEFEQPEGNIDTATFTPDGGALFTGVSEPNGDLSFDDTLSRWDLGSTTRTFTVGGVVERIMGCVAFRNTVRFSPGGDTFVAPFHDFTVSLRNTSDGSVIHEFPPHLSTVLDLAISPDGEALVTSSDDWTMRVWNLDDATSISEFETAPGGYLSLAFLPDGDSLIVTDVSGALHILDLETGEVSPPFVRETSPGTRISISPDGRYVAAGTDDNTIAIWEIASGTVIDELAGHDGIVESVAFTPDGRRLVSGSQDGTVRLWDLETPSPS